MGRYRKIYATTKVSSIRAGKPMKQTLKQRFRNWLNDDNYVGETLTLDEGPSLDLEQSIRFSVYRASGGTVIETRRYDRINDVNHNRLHIVVDGDDLGASIGKIITMESLR